MEHVARVTVQVDAPESRVWEALTRPHLIKQYFFGTDVSTDWQVGSTITYRGEWGGKKYEDKGKILQVEPGRLLVSTYWSSMSGLPDIPEHYKTVRYELVPEGRGTRLTVIQDNHATAEEADHSAQNWQLVLDGMKRLVEVGSMPRAPSPNG